MRVQLAAQSPIASHRAIDKIASVPAAKRKLAEPSLSKAGIVASPSTIVQISPQGLALTTTAKTSRAGLQAPLPKSSGDKAIDAVLAGGDYWWRAANGQAILSNTFVAPKVRQIETSQSLRSLKYSWLAGTEGFLTSEDKTAFAALNAGQKTAVKSAFDYLSTLINVSFSEETGTPTSANIMFGTNTQTASAGYATYPNGNNGSPSKLLLANNGASGDLNSATKLGQKGEYGWVTLIHELGHAMGLKHPGSYNAGGGKTPGPYLPGAVDNRRMTIMSYNNPPNASAIAVSAQQQNGAYSYTYSLNSVNSTTYGVYDIAAMQYLYGAKTSTVASDLALDDNFADFRTLWAPLGIKVDASTTTRANLFDLRQGAYSSVAIKSKADNQAAIKASLKASGLSDPNADAASAKIMKSVGKKLYDGKNNLALSYGSKYGEVTGGLVGDQFFASNYSVTIDGKAGNDTLYLTGTAKDWLFNTGAGTATNIRNQAVITYRNIEKIAYYKETSSVIHA